MSLIKLEFYAIRLQQKGNSNVYENFDDVFPADSFKEFFTNFIQRFANRYDNKQQQKTFKVEGGSISFASDQRIISGIIKGGSFGIASEVENISTGLEKPKIETTDSVINPYYFLIYFPEGSSIGLVILQKKGQHGIATDFKSYFKKFIDDELINLRLEMTPYASKEALLELVRRSSVSQIIFKKYNNVSDVWDRYRDGSGSQQELNAQLTLSTKGKFWGLVKTNVEKFISDGRTNFFQIQELQDIGFDGDVETSIKLEEGKKERIVVLNDVDKFKLSFDVSYIDKNADGHPNFQSIDSEAKTLLTEHFHV